MISWFAGLLGPITCQTSDVPSIIFFIVSNRLRALFILYFCKFVKNEKTNRMNSARIYE